MSDNALECAFALVRAPHLGELLRARPVPVDTGELLEIASGSSSAVDAAATASGYTAAYVVEAARFYVQQVLLHPDADAYRVLGVQPGASDAQIRRHYRALQRWLHPDRSDAWEAVFATRVNQAREQLRAHADGPVPTVAHAAPSIRHSGPIPVTPVWRPVPVPSLRSRVHPAVPVSAVLALCGWLAWQAMERAGADFRMSGSDAPELRVPLVGENDGPPMQAKAAPTSNPGRARPVAEALTADDARLMPSTGARVDVDPMASEADQVDVLAEPMPAPLTRRALAAFAAAEEADADTDTVRLAVRSRIDPLPEADDPAEYVDPPQRMVPTEPDIDPATYAQAQRRGEQLLRYMADPDAPAPPIWNTPASMDAAASARVALGEQVPGRVSWGAPQWRVSAERAEFTVGLRSRRWLADAPAGHLRVAMEWREGDWRVAQVGWEQP